MPISNTELMRLVTGKTGNIYIARKGTVTVIEIQNGDTYLINNLAGGSAIVNPVAGYWQHSIDWSGNFSDYFTYGINPLPPKYGAKPLREITESQLEKLKARAECAAAL